MPKIIENLRDRLLDEAINQINNNGYGKTTVRSIAKACGVGVGTVYNYFESKDMLIATFMLDDWKKCIDGIAKDGSLDPETLLRSIYNALQGYIKKYDKLFNDSDAVVAFSMAFSDKHNLLRSQISALIFDMCAQFDRENKGFLADFVAEALITWTVAEKPFEDIYGILSKLLKTN